jgi:putative membrane protein
MKRGDTRRLHPASLAVLWLNDLRPWLLPLGALLLFSIGDRERLMWAWLLVPTMLWRLLNYLTLRYSVDPAGLWVFEGLLERTERRVLAERITHIAREQPALARLFDLWELKLETASGGAPEAVLRFVSQREAERIAGLLGHAQSTAAPAAAAAAATTELRLKPGEVLYLGFFAGRGWALALGFYALANELGLLDRLPLDQFDVEVHGSDVGLGLRHLVLLLVVLLGLKLLSLLDAALRFGGYRLRAEAGQLQLTSGLLTRRAARLKPSRLMRLALLAGPLDLRLQRARLKVDIAGSNSDDDEAETPFAQNLVPTMRLADWPKLQAWLEIPDDPRELHWHYSTPAYLRKERHEARIAAVCLGALVACWYPLWGLGVGLALLLAGEGYARRLARRHAFALTPAGLWLQRGLLGRTWLFLPRQRLEVADLRQSPWMRRFGLWALDLDSPHAQGIGESTEIEGLRPETAQRILRHLGLRAPLPGPTAARAQGLETPGEALGQP